MACCTFHIPTVNLKIEFVGSRGKSEVKFHRSLQDVLYAKLNSHFCVIIASIAIWSPGVIVITLFSDESLFCVNCTLTVFDCLLLQYCNGGDLAEYLHCKYTNLISICHMSFTNMCALYLSLLCERKN